MALSTGYLTWLELIKEPLPLLYNRGAVCIGMMHVMLPLFVLPLYGVMKRIDFSHSGDAAKPRLNAHGFLLFDCPAGFHSGCIGRGKFGFSLA